MNPKPKTPYSAKPKIAREWIDCLRGPEGIHGILARSEDLAKLKACLQQSLNNLELGHFSSKVEPVWVSGKPTELLLMVPNATIAARLQQSLPSLINELGKNSLNCTAIKVSLKPALPQSEWVVQPRAPAREKPKGLNPIARSAWLDLLSKLEPESDLSKAVQHLLQSKTGSP
jgi:hypothetical protein